jgi:hypothetical protein
MTCSTSPLGVCGVRADGRLLAVERRRVADLQAALATQTRQLREVWALRDFVLSCIIALGDVLTVGGGNAIDACDQRGGGALAQHVPGAAPRRPPRGCHLAALRKMVLAPSSH